MQPATRARTVHVDGLEQGPEVHALGSAGAEVGDQLAAGFGGDVEVPHLGGHIDQEAQEAGLCVAPDGVHPVHPGDGLGACG